MKDPVCGMEVMPESAAAAWEHDGTVYYFCSLGCLGRFKEDPEHYLGLDDAQRVDVVNPRGICSNASESIRSKGAMTCTATR